MGYKCEHALYTIKWDAWVAQRLSVCLQLKAWSQGLEIKSHIGLLTGKLLLPLSVSLLLSLCLSWINKLKKKRIIYTMKCCRRGKCFAYWVLELIYLAWRHSCSKRSSVGFGCCLPTLPGSWEGRIARNDAADQGLLLAPNRPFS